VSEKAEHTRGGLVFGKLITRGGLYTNARNPLILKVKTDYGQERFKVKWSCFGEHLASTTNPHGLFHALKLQPRMDDMNSSTNLALDKDL